MVATADALYMGDTDSCKVIDAETGDLRDEYVIDADQADGPVWKWMAIRDGVLYALVGNQEIKVDTQKSARRGLGHWPWGMWEGHDYDDLKTAFGFGRTFVAIDLTTGKTRWQKSEDQFIDARSVCMAEDRIFYYCPNKFLSALNIDSGVSIWKNGDQELLEAIGKNGRAQHYVTGLCNNLLCQVQRPLSLFCWPATRENGCSVSR